MAYKRLSKTSYIGPQYIWIGEFSILNKGLELCIEMSNSKSGATYCLIKNGVIKKVSNGDYSY